MPINDHNNPEELDGITVKSDKKTIERIATAHPRLRDELLKIYGDICAELTGRSLCRFSHVLRSFAEQEALYAQGRTKPGKKVTNAKAGQSYHNYGLAVDIVLIIDGKTASWDMKSDFDSDLKSDWLEIVAIFKRYGWEWGGDWKGFKDYPHFQKTFGKSTSQLLPMQKDKAGYPNLQ